MAVSKSSIDLDYIINLFTEQFPEEHLILKALKKLKVVGGVTMHIIIL